MSRSNSYIIDIRIFEEEDLFDKVFLFMPEYRREKTEKFRNVADKRRSLGAGVILEYGLLNWFSGKNNHQELRIITRSDIIDLLSDNYGNNNQLYSKNILFTDKEKPYYPAGLPYFNLSHSGDFAVGIFDVTPVGIDIEKITTVSTALCKKVLSADEMEFFQTLSADEKQKEFIRIWTAKEAYLKMTGDGITRELRDFTVWDGKALQNFDDLEFIEYSIPDYRLTVCRKT